MCTVSFYAVKAKMVLQAWVIIRNENGDKSVQYLINVS